MSNTTLKAIITIELEIPEECTEFEAMEWLNFETGNTNEMDAFNPLERYCLQDMDDKKVGIKILTK